MTEHPWHASLAQLTREASRTSNTRHGVLCWYRERGSDPPFPEEDSSSLYAAHQVRVHRVRCYRRKEGVSL